MLNCYVVEFEVSEGYSSRFKT